MCSSVFTCVCVYVCILIQSGVRVGRGQVGKPAPMFSSRAGFFPEHGQVTVLRGAASSCSSSLIDNTARILCLRKIASTRWLSPFEINGMLRQNVLSVLTSALCSFWAFPVGLVHSLG